MAKNEDTPMFRALHLEALSLQGSCNLSGLVTTFSIMMSKLWEVDRNTEQIGTAWVNSNAVTRIMVSTMLSLTDETKLSDWEVPELH